jgi:predicted nuclease of restriction endonuclease-like (RecB) superfamily
MDPTKNNRSQRGKQIDEVVFPQPESILHLPKGYPDFINSLKELIAQERIKTILSANAAMIRLYWEIGHSILKQQLIEGWGAKVIDRLSYDLKKAFPEMSGFSPRNLKYMRKFAEAWPDVEIVQRTVALIPWRSNITLLDKLNDEKTRLWYAQKTIENGFGKEMLIILIASVTQTSRSSFKQF